MARFEDVADLSTGQQLHDALRLDYDRSPFPTLDRYHALRWEAPEDVRVSRHSSLGGDGTTDGWTDPYTGNGFLKSPELIPEYRILKNADGELPPIRSGAEIWEISRDGLQRLVAAFDGNNWIGVAR